MKKYKLIKEYPGSPKLGTEIEKRTIYSDNWMYKRDCNLFPVTSGTPDDYPEFWEEVVEKDYEILSFYRGNRFFTKTDSKSSELFPYWSKENTWINFTTECIIHSIKRLSDGEVFTIGDNTNEGVIAEFQLCKDDRFIISFIDGLPRYLDAKGSTHVLKVKKPLFTTEDGVDIYEGDDLVDLYEVSKYGYLLSRCSKQAAISEGFSEHVLYFANKKNAKEYILMNKPCLSIAEIAPVIGMCNNSKIIDLDLLTEKLKAIVKEKI